MVFIFRNRRRHRDPRTKRLHFKRVTKKSVKTANSTIWPADQKKNYADNMCVRLKYDLRFRGKQNYFSVSEFCCTTYDTRIRDCALRAYLFAYRRNLRVKKNKIISSFAYIPLNVIFIVTIMFRARGFIEITILRSLLLFTFYTRNVSPTSV